jgi:hypothetical protein
MYIKNIEGYFWDSWMSWQLVHVKNGSIIFDLWIFTLQTAFMEWITIVNGGIPVSYEGESVNRSQMDIRHKTCDIGTWKKHLFLDMSSANIDTLVLLLYQCVETCSIEILLTVISATCASSATFEHPWENFLTQLWTTLHDTLLKPASEHACLLPRLLWSWTMLLSSDTHRKPITSVTVVLLPFVTYILTLPCIYLDMYTK